MQRRLLPIALLVGLLVPASAFAEVPTLTVRDLPLHAERAPAMVGKRFELVGLHWRGEGEVEYRTRSLDGGWSEWRPAKSDLAHAPDGHASIRDWKRGAGVWVGPSDGLDVRTAGPVRRVRAFTVRSPVSGVPLRTTASAGEPGVISRSSWRADEAIRRAEPAFAPSLRMAYVHHTATRNDYSPAESAAIVRAIQLYHVKSNGWNDIGYNAVVDRYGAVFEGRYGGLEKNVIGAHARGFNTGSFGVAIIGDFRTEEPPQVALDALAGLLAWRLDLAHVDPVSWFTAISGGSEKFASGAPVQVRAVSGHRDTGATICPGNRLYAQLDEIATRSAEIGLPKLYEPAVDGGVGGQVHFTARLSEALPWAVIVTDSAGGEVARGEGAGVTVDWTWDATAVAPESHGWRIEADGATPAEGTLGLTGPAAPTAVQIADLFADPEVITPNGDGQSDEAAAGYSISVNANVSAAVIDGAEAVLAEIEAPRWRRAGPHTFSFAGLDLPDGPYRVRIRAKVAEGIETIRDVPVTISRTLAASGVIPTVMTPNGDGRGDRLRVGFRLTHAAEIRVRVFREGTWVATPFSGPMRAGIRAIVWDGRKRLGWAQDGEYEAVVEAAGPITTSRVIMPFTLDAKAPVVRIRSRKPAWIWVSEPARLVIRANGAVRRITVREAGAVRLRGIKRLQSLTVVARDDAGNVSRFSRKR